MWRLLTRLALLAALLIVGGSSYYTFAEEVIDRHIRLTATPLRAPDLTSSARVKFVAGWELKSDDLGFGGLSGLFVTASGLLAVSDKGALVELHLSRGAPSGARIRPLPEKCGQGRIKLHRDTESLASDKDGNVWIGFEWRNALCRTGPGLRRATALAVPEQMRIWPYTGGPEAMTRLRDGRMIVIAERSRGDRAETPMLVFATDPALPGARAQELSYRPPPGYRPTDIAELPNGSLLVLHRRFRAPFSFSSILSVLPVEALRQGASIRSRALALFKAPGLHDNFEGVAVEARGGRTFVWLVSDNNFAPVQKTYLLKLELTGG